jgi:hypothetical protein
MGAARTIDLEATRRRLEPMTPTATDARSRLHRVEEQLHPERVRTRAIEELNELFAGSGTPDPLPHGLLRGRAISPTIAAGFDAVGRRLAAFYMPWLGKKFDAQANEGVNVLARSALRPMKLFWPSYEPNGIFSDRIEAFPFKTSVDRSAVDPDLQVLRIEYDLDANPSFVIRRVVDELVQIDRDLYLGKVLLRRKGELRSIGFFALEK